MSSQFTNPNYAPRLDPEKGRSLRGLSAALVALTGTAIILRFWSCATSSKKKFGPDDWIAFASWPLVATLDLIAFELMKSGFGRHVKEVPLGDIRKGLKLLYASYFVYNLGMTMIRCSAILFYNRVFELHRSQYRYVIWCGLGLNVAWFGAFGSVALVPCTPVHAFWDKPILAPSSYNCSSTLSIQLSSGITSVLMDLFVLLLPIPCLLKLKTSWRNKVRVCFIFFMGYCVIIITIGRLVSITREGKALDEDITWAFVTTTYWFVCEISVANICISLPSIFRLTKRATDHGLSALLNDKKYPTGTSHPSKSDGEIGDDGFIRLTNEVKIEREREIRLSACHSIPKTTSSCV